MPLVVVNVRGCGTIGAFLANANNLRNAEIPLFYGEENNLPASAFRPPAAAVVSSSVRSQPPFFFLPLCFLPQPLPPPPPPLWTAPFPFPAGGSFGKKGGGRRKKTLKAQFRREERKGDHYCKL